MKGFKAFLQDCSEGPGFWVIQKYMLYVAPKDFYLVWCTQALWPEERVHLPHRLPHLILPGSDISLCIKLSFQQFDFLVQCRLGLGASSQLVLFSLSMTITNQFLQVIKDQKIDLMPNFINQGKGGQSKRGRFLTLGHMGHPLNILKIYFYFACQRAKYISLVNFMSRYHQMALNRADYQRAKCP